MKVTDQERDAAMETKPYDEQADATMESKPYDEQAVSSDAYPVKNYRLGWAVVKQ